MISSSSAVLSTGPLVFYVTPEYFTNPASSHTPPTYVQGPLFNATSDVWNGTEFPALSAKVRSDATLGNLKRLGVSKCNKTQASFYQTEYTSLVFVQDSVIAENNSLIEIGYYGISGVDSGPNETSVPLNYYNLVDCWGMTAEGANCQLFLNPNLLLGVIAANIIKCSVMFLIAIKVTKQSLVTLGDGISSFLATKDPTTEGLRSFGERKLVCGNWKMSGAVRYTHKQRHWGSAPSGLRWAISITM